MAKYLKPNYDYDSRGFSTIQSKLNIEYVHPSYRFSEDYNYNVNFSILKVPDEIHHIIASYLTDSELHRFDAAFNLKDNIYLKNRFENVLFCPACNLTFERPSKLRLHITFLHSDHGKMRVAQPCNSSLLTINNDVTCKMCMNVKYEKM